MTVTHAIGEAHRGVIQVKMLYRQIANDHFFPHFMDEDIRAHCSEFHREVIRIHLDLQDLIQ